ncbi:glycosyl transferase family 1 [Leptolyngbya sp. 'hensonii']|uniref:glycosyltransferase family 4 protein n=1 Tax=Leptolyngbya sp. 'hensonii' TaxID=1922337 RepID=UPI00094FA827|nr:glycosyltransferase family 4 protein [Leptolyngbya sp. 'hensonii']OLP18781.1 glycosyl transferase family 1 [Leptolyngbya sp. 'hensonii']
MAPRISLAIIHPNPFARNTAIALAAAGLLQEIVTTIAYNPTGRRSLKWLPQSLLRELERRTWVPPAGVSLQTYQGRELIRLLLVRTGLSSRLGLGAAGPVDWVSLGLDQEVAHHHLTDLDAIYAYEDGAATTFTAAKAQGIRCFYDLAIAFYPLSQKIQAAEAEHFPDLAVALEAAQEPPWKIARKHQEIQLADHIFVPSTFVQQSLLESGIAAERVTIVPFGAPIEYFQPQPKPDDRFRVLFVGRVGPRKGVHYLLQSWKSLHLPDAELLLVGLNEFPEPWLSPYEGLFRYVPSVPHASLNQYYSSASVLVLPSLVEGMPLVLLEAMACGIPLITTPHAGGTDLITDGREGFIIPIRDPAALEERLAWCYHHPVELAEMGQAARRRAEILTWDLYRQRMGTRIQQLLGDRP